MTIVDNNLWVSIYRMLNSEQNVYNWNDDMQQSIELADQIQYDCMFAEC